MQTLQIWLKDKLETKNCASMVFSCNDFFLNFKMASKMAVTLTVPSSNGQIIHPTTHMRVQLVTRVFSCVGS